jgi:predicted adenine nucleotide alpha hydrolase (AANH) superfamily ATPase
MIKNYQKMMENEINLIKKSGRKPSLLLQVCCAPCSSSVLEKLSMVFDITLFFYNPNISPKEEFLKRFEELKRLNAELGTPANIIKGEYDHERFLQMSEGLEDLEEGGKRCFRCYEMRLRKTASLARSEGYDYFTTTLSVSPYKNAEKLNEIGERLSEEYGIPYLYSDFKKKEGYKRSIELSKKHSLYRQDYCGCRFSKMQAEKKRQENLPPSNR